MGSEFRLACQLQTGTDNLETSKDEKSSPLSNSEAVAVCEKLTKKVEKGSNKFLLKDKKKGFEKALSSLIKKIKKCKGTGYLARKGDGDSKYFREEFTYNRQKYRIDLRLGGGIPESNWFV